MAELSLRKVTKQFGTVTALSGIDLEIAHREFVVIVGPSGCGKSTLLRVIAGLEQLTTGEIHVGGEAVHRTPAAKRGLAMVFQNYALYPHKTVAQNMGFALKMAKTPKPEIDERVDSGAHPPDRGPAGAQARQLSGGQRQRVAIGRAIVREPKVFLFDEPLSNLDAALRVDMRVELAKLHNTLDATMIYVTHDQTEAMTMADKIVILRSGRMEQVGSPMELYHRPVNAFVAGFIGSPRMNILPTSITAVTDHTVTVALPAARPCLCRSAARKSRPRPRFARYAAGTSDIGADGPGPTVDMKVYVTEPLGGETILYGHVSDDQTLVVKVPGELPVATGERIPVHVNPASCHLFDANDIALPRQA